MSLIDVEDVVPLRDKFDTSVTDEEWLSVLAGEGDWAIVSKDGFKKSDAEKRLIQRAGLTVFVLAPAWNKSPHWDATVQIVRWWPKLVDVASVTRAALRVPWNVSSKLDSIKL
jgi:hypothetical protein